MSWVVPVCGAGDTALGWVAGRGASADPTLARLLALPPGQLAAWVALAVFVAFVVRGPRGG